MSMLRLTLAAVCGLTLTGCAATGVAISKRNLDVQTKMSESVFLDPAAPQNMKVLVQIRNTSDKPDFTIQREVEASLQARGWTIVRDPAQAKYMLQANILQVGKMDPTAAQQMFSSGYGGALGTGVVAAGAAYAIKGPGYGREMAGVGLLAAGAEFISGQMVKDVYYSVITDVQISQHTGGTVRMSGQQNLKQGTGGYESLSYQEDSNWRRYRTRVISSANKVNLAWEEAQPELVRGLTQSIGGMF